MKTKGLTSMGVFLLLFLLSIALAASLPSVYVVEESDGGWWFDYDGIYEERSNPKLHYKRIGGPGRDGDYRFLYTEPDHPDTWSFGKGKDLSDVTTIFRAPARVY